MRIHHLLDDTRAEGFGSRFCIWVQGCSHHCPGCMAQDTWDPSGGTEIPAEELMARLEARVRNTDKLPLEGVTFLGGEPFEQAEPLSRIAALAGELGLSVITFSGYTLEQLHTSLLPGSGSLLAHTDLLIDGPYVQSLREFRRPWVGSANQRFLFLTDRYSPVDLETVHNQCEIRIAPDGTVSINGMADFTTIWSKLL